jgi:regulator of nonsense transcripts 2
MYYVGLTDDVRLVLDILADAMQRDKREWTDGAHSPTGLQTAVSSFSHLSLLLSFLRYGGDEFVQTTPLRTKELYALLPTAAAPPLLGCVPAELRERCRHMFDQYWALVSGRYASLTAEMRKKEKRLLKMEVMRGDISDDMRREGKMLRDNWERLHALVLQMVDALDKVMPVIVEQKDTEDEEDVMSLVVVSLATEEAAGGPYEDEEQRSFYTQLLDLTLVVPPSVLLRDGDKDAEEEEKHEDAVDKPASSPTSGVKPDASDPHDRRQPRRGRRRRGADDGDDEMSIEELERRLAQLNETKAAEEEMEADDDATALSAHQPLDAILLSLRSSFSAEAIDAVASRFAFLNSRPNRTRLISYLLHLPRSTLALLPFAARTWVTSCSPP